MSNISQIDRPRVTVGVDTHQETHVAVVLDALGRRLGSLSAATTTDGYRSLVTWAETYGDIEGFGVEGTGSYGAGLARYLKAAGFAVVEVNRPNRQARRNGKSDTVDAEAAARSVLAGETAGEIKSGDDAVEQIRVIRVARRGAMKARTQTLNALRALLVTAPPDLRDQLRRLPTTKLVATAARLRPGSDQSVVAANKTALRSLADTYLALDAQITQLDKKLDHLTSSVSPQLVAAFGVGTDVAGALLVTAGDNPDRLRSEAAFAMLCGVAPIEASSGKVTRHRLNRGGDRQANAALYHIVIVRMRYHAATRRYVERRTAEGLSKPEIIRCLKRYVAREIYRILQDPAISQPSAA